MTFTKIHERYTASLPCLTETDLETTNAFLHDLTPLKLDQWTSERTVVNHLGGRAFRMVVDHPDDGDRNQAVVVTGEFGGGRTPANIVRARIIREMVNPAATLVVQPNSTFREPNMNYQRAERHLLRRGRLDPLLGRIATTLGAVGNPKELTILGSSQGSVSALGLATRDYLPPSAVAVLEAPGVKERSRRQLLLDFVCCGGDLNSIISENYADSAHPLLEETLRGLSVSERMRYALGIMKPDNTATIGILLRANAEQAMQTTIRRGGSIVHAWGTEDKVSPPEDNRLIAKGIQQARMPRYEAYELAGADHSISNNYSLVGALARRANLLLRG